MTSYGIRHKISLTLWSNEEQKFETDEHLVRFKNCQ
jgi:hypothetical protein